MTDQTVRLRAAGKRKDGKVYGSTGQLTVPSTIAKLLPWGTVFRCELTEEGILYRPTEGVAAADPQLPDWVASLPAKEED